MVTSFLRCLHTHPRMLPDVTTSEEAPPRRAALSEQAMDRHTARLHCIPSAHVWDVTTIPNILWDAKSPVELLITIVLPYRY